MPDYEKIINEAYKFKITDEQVDLISQDIGFEVSSEQPLPSVVTPKSNPVPAMASPKVLHGGVTAQRKIRAEGVDASY